MIRYWDPSHNAATRAAAAPIKLLDVPEGPSPPEDNHSGPWSYIEGRHH